MAIILLERVTGGQGAFGAKAACYLLGIPPASGNVFAYQYLAHCTRVWPWRYERRATIYVARHFRNIEAAVLFRRGLSDTLENETPRLPVWKGICSENIRYLSAGSKIKEIGSRTGSMTAAF